jgi:hypothetical protein
MERIVNGTVLYSDLNNEVLSAQKLCTHTFYVHLKLYICASYHPVGQLIIERMTGMATTAHLKPVLC